MSPLIGYAGLEYKICFINKKKIKIKTKKKVFHSITKINMPYYNYISFNLFLILIIHPFLGVESFTPLGRIDHSSILFENKIYFFGGEVGNENDNYTNDVFFLDVSQQFNV